MVLKRFPNIEISPIDDNVNFIVHDGNDTGNEVFFKRNIEDISSSLQKLVEQTKHWLSGYDESHGFAHAVEVATIASQICRKVHTASEDEFRELNNIAVAISLLHDVWDYKYVNDPHELEKRVTECAAFLIDTVGFCIVETQTIIHEISLLSFSKGNTPLTEAGKIAQDADRITGFGSTGILRSAYYSAKKKRSFKDLIAHMQEKFLGERMTMNYRESETLLTERRELLVHFIHQFEIENADNSVTGFHFY